MTDSQLPSITGRKIKWALIGCGRISKNHFSAINDFADDIELVAVCDTVKERADQAAQEQGCKAFYDAEEMFKAGGIDIVSLCTPSGVHPTHAILAAKYKVNVLTEKPMGTRLKDGREMIEQCKENNVHLFVVKQNRFNPTILKVREAIDQERFGQIFFAQVNVFWTRPQEYYDLAKWRGTRDLDGGALMNQASHYVDLLTWLIGPVDQVMAITSTLQRKIEMEDTAAVSLRWKNGALGSINATVLTFPKNIEGSLTILGEKGTVKIGGVAVNEVLNWEFSDNKDSKEDINKASYATDSVYGFGHPVFYKNVIKTLRQDRDTLTCDGAQGIQSLELLEAIYQSSSTKTSVQLPLES